MYAYSELYLQDAMNNLGEAFEYAGNACKINLETFVRLFIATGYADKYETGVPKVVVGLSGTELVYEILSKAGVEIEFPKPIIDYTFPKEYWCGYVLAYYQWITNKSYKDMFEVISISDILKLYPILHEASEDKFVDALNAIIGKNPSLTKLQGQRKICGLTQKELSIKSGINLRTLQQYETRAKDLNQAAISTVYRLSNVLGCKMEDLLER